MNQKLNDRLLSLRRFFHHPRQIRRLISNNVLFNIRHRITHSLETVNRSLEQEVEAVIQKALALPRSHGRFSERDPNLVLADRGQIGSRYFGETSRKKIGWIVLNSFDGFQKSDAVVGKRPSFEPIVIGNEVFEYIQLFRLRGILRRKNPLSCQHFPGAPDLPSRRREKLQNKRCRRQKEDGSDQSSL